MWTLRTWLAAATAAPLVVLAGHTFFERTKLICQAADRRLSIGELEDIAIKNVINAPPYAIGIAEFEQNLLANGYVRYRDVQSFRTANPGCCNISKKGSDGTVTFTEILFGRTADWVNLNYRLFYRTPMGTISAVRLRQSYPIDRCGENSID